MHRKYHVELKGTVDSYKGIVVLGEEERKEILHWGDGMEVVIVPAAIYRSTIQQSREYERKVRKRSQKSLEHWYPHEPVAEET